LALVVFTAVVFTFVFLVAVALAVVVFLTVIAKNGTSSESVVHRAGE
jgi:hypothetical protein